MALQSEKIAQFWEENGLANIIPFREGAEFPDGPEPLDALVHMVGGDSVLEFGCGRGRLAPLFDERAYHGVDISQKSLDVAGKACPAHKFSRIEAYGALPHADVAFAYTVLHHIPDETVELAVERLCEAAPRVIIAEVMDPRFRHENMPPCLNRSRSEYAEMFSWFGYAPARVEVVNYLAYTDRLMTLVEFC